jgi:hypothetical protein
MIIFEIFKKSRSFEPILKKTWQRISTDIPYPPLAEDDPRQKLLYFGMLAYAAVFESALAAGMSTSAAHYLARMQIGKYKLGKPISRAVADVFSGHESDEERAYAEFFLTRLAGIIAMVRAGEGDVAPIMRELAQGFRRATF